MIKETSESFVKNGWQIKEARLNTIVNIYGEIPENVPDGCYLSISRKRSNGIHSLGNPQPAKFIPEIPRWAIRKYSKKGEIILDPFVGSGTTMVEALLLGRSAYGIDHNPLARLIAKVKSTPLEYEVIVKEKRKLETAIYNKKNSECIELPNFRNRDFWFDRQASEGIAIIRECIQESVESNDVKDFFTVILSDVVRKVSKIGYGQILPAKRSKKNTRDLKMSREHVFKIFFDHLRTYIPIMREFSSKADKNSFAKIIGNDARKIDIQHQVDLIVTSPPYINSHHYIWANKLRLLQLKLVDDKERLALMRKEIGTEEFSAREYNELGKTGIDEIDEKISRIYFGHEYKASGNQNKIRARSVFQYFQDMKIHLTEAYKVLRDDGFYILVVGDNKICKVHIPTADFLAKIAEMIGFKKISRFSIILKNRTLNIPRNVTWADITLFDHIWVFKK